MGKTFISLFSSFKKEDLCQLYIYPTFPDVDVANAYYRITDRDALKAIISTKCVGNEVFVHKNGKSIIVDQIDAKIYSKESNNSAIKRLFRDVIWSLSHWYSEELKIWLDKEKPTCIFLAPGYAKFIYNIALKIAKEREIPIYTYICDDYYFLETPNTILGRYQQYTLRQKIRQVMSCTKRLITISEEIKDRYINEFLIDTEVIMTGANIQPLKVVEMREKINAFSYFGNISVNREMSLADIGRALDEINEENDSKCYLNIYSKIQNQNIRDMFSDIKSIRMCEFLVGEAFIEKFLTAECLIHVEAFDEKSIDLVKGSISTKIADSLASGIPLLAYGPLNIASINHLKKNNCAFCINRHEDLKGVLYQVINDCDKRKEITENALKIAKKYHDSNENSEYLKGIINQE